MTKDSGRKPEGAPERSPKSWRRRPFGRRQEGAKRFSEDARDVDQDRLVTKRLWSPCSASESCRLAMPHKFNFAEIDRLD
jgi:hypothetical protein